MHDDDEEDEDGGHNDVGKHCKETEKFKRHDGDD